MPCERYKEILIDAVASGDPLPLDLRAHLDSCAACRAAFDNERRLLAAINSGLCASANVPTPPSLLPAVHLRLAQEDATISSRPLSANWIYLATTAALILALFPLLRPRDAKEPRSESYIASTASASVGAGLQPSQPSVSTSRVAHTQAQTKHAHVVVQYSELPAEPDVIVPPDERVALTRYLSRRDPSSARPKSLAVAVANSSSAPQVEPLIIEPLQIAQLELQTLEEQLRQADNQTRTR